LLPAKNFSPELSPMSYLFQRFWTDEEGQDIAEYAVMVAVILIVVVGTIRLIGSNANTVFSNVASSVQ
jgi:Flp pilus assembly pilin Flp